MIKSISRIRVTLIILFDFQNTLCNFIHIIKIYTFCSPICPYGFCQANI